MKYDKEPMTVVDHTRYNRLPALVKFIYIVLTISGLILTIYMVFSFRIGGFLFIDTAFFYLIFAFFMPGVFLILPARKNDTDKPLPVYDIFASVLMFVISIFFALNALEISQSGWSDPSGLILVISFIWILLIIESARRGGGVILASICLVMAIYPLVANHMPSVLFGVGYTLPKLISFHAFTTSGLPGLMPRVLGFYIIGFLSFSGVLINYGCGEFFMNLATALMGKYRGGPAKVAIISSALFGTLSGSGTSNVVATGSFTIPTMKKIGFSPEYAGAIEAVASTGGVIMPPVMGAVAFTMAATLQTKYSTIITAAFIPAILYYFGLVIQVDINTAKIKMRGLPAKECPILKEVLKDGWIFLFTIVFLIWGLLYMQWETKTPYYASFLLLVMATFFRKHKNNISLKYLIETIGTVGRMINRLAAAFLPIGLIISGLQATGVGFSLTSELVSLGGANILLVLIFGVIACYIMGMAGLITPAYIFLSVSLAPAVIKLGGFSPMAIHLFILYYACLAGITPPVAMSAYVAATIAGSDPIRTSVLASRLGFVVYIIPFFFVFNPALILQGPFIETLYLIAFCLVGLTIFAFGLEGYVYRIGRINFLERLFMLFGGFLIAFPNVKSTLAGIIIILLGAVIMWVRRRGPSDSSDDKTNLSNR